MGRTTHAPAATESHVLEHRDLAVEELFRRWQRHQDERARECIRLLLNLIESLTADLRKSQAENLYLREQLNRRQGGGGKPGQPKDTAGAKSQSSEKERAETKQRTRRGKLERVRVDREEVLNWIGPLFRRMCSSRATKMWWYRNCASAPTM